MVSRRNFFSICIMMVVILMLFQFSVLIRQFGIDSNVNTHLPEVGLSRKDSWSLDRATDENGNFIADAVETIVYIGDSKKAVVDVISQWCEYTKRRLVQYASLEEYEEAEEDIAVLLCITGSEIDTDQEIERLCSLALGGQTIVFCDLPEVSYVSQKEELRSLLGIQQVRREEVELTGVRLFSGFLLGGEVIYQPEEGNEKQEKMQDMELFVPWYITLQNTKSYMVGLLEDEVLADDISADEALMESLLELREERTEEEILADLSLMNKFLPSLIWRNSYGGTPVFVVNGDYMYDQTGLGILSAILYESQEYEVYPVVNAQNLSVANYPSFALENTEEMMEIYARNLRRLQMDILWPNLIAAAAKGNYQMTSLLVPQMDYSTNQEIYVGDIDFYLQQFKEQNVEAGVSLDYLDGISIQEKVARDQEFFDSLESEYEYGSAYIASEDVEALSEMALDALGNIRTVTGLREDTDPILSYCTDTVVDQSVTADGFFHTYSQDFRVRAVETALGYSNILLDMKIVAWPQEDTPHWEILYEAFSSNINTYWNAFSTFDKTTLSESDERIRSFLAMDYNDERDGNTILVEIGNRTGDVWFVLRTHSESIVNIIGGEYQEIEGDAYLIRAQEDHLEIEVEPDTDLKYHLP